MTELCQLRAERGTIVTHDPEQRSRSDEAQTLEWRRRESSPRKISIGSSQ
jgi:hypothetical protein